MNRYIHARSIKNKWSKSDGKSSRYDKLCVRKIWFDKIKLASDLIGVSPLANKEVFNTFADSLPCIYLFHIGTIKNLRKSMKNPDKYDNSDLVVKWGFSNDLARRTKEHSNKKSYGGIKGSNISLLYNSIIDPQHISLAEIDIKEYFIDNDYHFQIKKYSELAIIPKKRLHTIKKQYKLLGKSYMGHLKELHAQIESIKNKHNIELANKDTKLANKDTELANKEIEILRIKLKYSRN